MYCRNKRSSFIFYCDNINQFTKFSDEFYKMMQILDYLKSKGKLDFWMLENVASMNIEHREEMSR